MDIRGWKAGIVAAFAAIYLIWGSTYLAIKIAITTIPPFTMTAARALTAGTVLYCWGRWRGGLSPTPAQWVGGAMVGGLLFLGGHGGLAWAERRVPSGTAALFVATLPLWMTFMEKVSERDILLTPSGWRVAPRNGRLTLRTAGGLAAGMAGILLLLGPGSLLGSEPVDLTGGVVLVLCALSWALGSALARRKGQPSSLTVAMGTYLLTGGGLLLVAAGFSGELRGAHVASVSGSSLAGLAYLILFGTVVAFSAYTWLLRRASLAAVSTYAFVNPIVAVFLGWGLGGELLNLRILAAAVLVVGAVGLILTGAEKRSPQPGMEKQDDRTHVAWTDTVQRRPGVRGVRERDGHPGATENPWQPGLHDSPARPRRRDRDPGGVPVGDPGECTGLCR
jgi:drug/metabolite transporter (DMT)-like permease